jgi:hypothetical protein
MPQTPRKKKVIKDLSFDHDTGHVALVGPAVGGPANGSPEALLLKASDTFTQEIIEKASKVQVTLPIEEFLTKFFGMYYDDAEILARVMGYTTQTMEYEAKEVAEPIDYTSYIDNKVQSIQIMKSMRKEDGTIAAVDTLGTLDGQAYLSLLQDQERIEKAFEESEKITKSKVSLKESESKAKPLESDSSTNASVEKETEPSGSINKSNKGTRMADKEVKTVVADVEKELVEKSVLVDVQKALDEQVKRASELEAIVKQFEQEKKDLIVKARKEKLQATVKNQEQAETLFKALGLVEDEGTFDEVLKALGTLQELADKSDLFKSVGADGEVEQKADTGADITKSLSERIKQKYSK